MTGPTTHIVQISDSLQSATKNETFPHSSTSMLDNKLRLSDTAHQSSNLICSMKSDSWYILKIILVFTFIDIKKRIYHLKWTEFPWIQGWKYWVLINYYVVKNYNFLIFWTVFQKNKYVVHMFVFETIIVLYLSLFKITNCSIFLVIDISHIVAIYFKKHYHKHNLISEESHK